jgi:hypothetical protein
VGTAILLLSFLVALAAAYADRRPPETSVMYLGDATMPLSPIAPLAKKDAAQTGASTHAAHAAGAAQELIT